MRPCFRRQPRCPGHTDVMARSSRMVRFFEIKSEAQERLAEVDVKSHFFDVVSRLPQSARDHWQSGQSGSRVRGRVYRATEASKKRCDLIVLDRVHREPGFAYVRNGAYSPHSFAEPDQDFAEPKFLAFFEHNIVATFAGGLPMERVEAALNTWRVKDSLAPIVLEPMIDTDRLAQLSKVNSVGMLSVTLPSHTASQVYKNRKTSVAQFFRSRAVRDGKVTVTLSVDAGDQQASDELRNELSFLLEDDTYAIVTSDPSSKVEASFLTEDSARRRHHNFLGQSLTISVRVDVPEPEAGPRPEHASEALTLAFSKRRERLLQIVGVEG